MPISEKILAQVEKADASAEDKKLMLEILKIEDKGTFRFQAEYESIIKVFIAEHGEGDE